jgi:hypothetical protein
LLLRLARALSTLIPDGSSKLSVDPMLRPGEEIGRQADLVMYAQAHAAAAMSILFSFGGMSEKDAAEAVGHRISHTSIPRGNKSSKTRAEAVTDAETVKHWRDKFNRKGRSLKRAREYYHQVIKNHRDALSHASPNISAGVIERQTIEALDAVLACLGFVPKK